MPLRCVFCGTRSRPPERRICRGCRDDLPWVVHACRRCGMPLATVLPGDVECAACQQRPALLQMTVAPLLYEFPVDAGIKALKFGRKLYYAAAFAELLVGRDAAAPGGHRRAVAGAAALAAPGRSWIQPGGGTLQAACQAVFTAGCCRSQPLSGYAFSVEPGRATASQESCQCVPREACAPGRARSAGRRRRDHRGNHAHSRAHACFEAASAK